MRFSILLIIFFFGFNYSKAQDSSQFLGRWKVVAMNNGVYYDYKRETYLVDTALSNSLRGRSDSVEVIGDFLDWSRSCPNCFFVFGAGNKYQEYREYDLRSDGTYQLKSKDKQIEVRFMKDGVAKQANYKFSFVGKSLVLFVPSFFIPKDIELTLEKIE
jgi:hypothetical protein